MKILVTGGAGYIGSHVCKLLRIQGTPHLAYDDLSAGHLRHLPASQCIQDSITNANGLQHAMADFKPDTVIHLAALANVPECERDSKRAVQVNVEGTRHILEAMRMHNVRCIVFASSCAVYAPVGALRPFAETDPLQPCSVYGHTKLACEQLLAHYYAEHGIRHMALRIFNVAGADSDGEIGEAHHPETHLLPLALQAALSADGIPLQLYGDDYPTADGTAIRDYVHVWNVAEALWRSAEHLAATDGNMILNLGSGIPTSALQMIQAVERCTGRPVPRRVLPRRSGDAPYLLGDISRLKGVLGISPYDLGAIVQTACRWHEKMIKNPA